MLNLKIAINGLLVTLLVASALGQEPQLEKASAPPPALTPLAMSVGGRVLTMPVVGSQDEKDYAAEWPGSHFEAAFKGEQLYFSVGSNHEILHVVVDKRPPMILSNPAAGMYRVSGLKNQPHVVSVSVVTESAYFYNHFGGFSIPSNEKALPPPTHSRQIEFIGDSHTVGYGNSSSTQVCTTDEVWATTDTSQAFGPLTAGHYDADYQVNAISGRGVVRNFDGSPGDTIPESYPYSTFDKKQMYSDPNWKPQVIVIALGTNDFATALHAGETWKTRDDLHSDYEAKYVLLIKGLRAKNPKAYIILWAANLFNGEIETEVQKVVAATKIQGEENISFIPVDHLAFSACHFHPSLSDDKLIEEKLIQVIDSVPHIWQEK